MQLLLTFALVFIVGDAAKLIWGREEHSVAMPAILAGRAQAFGLVFPIYRLFLIAAGAVGGGRPVADLISHALGHLHPRSDHGPGDALARSASIHASSSPRSSRSARRSPSLGGALAAPVVAVGPGLHVQVIIDAFVVVVIGGLGSVLGAFVASLLVGLVNAFGVLAVSGSRGRADFRLHGDRAHRSPPGPAWNC